MREVVTTCARDCWDACGMIVEVREGRAVSLSGHPEHPITKGFLCKKTGTRFLDRVYAKERILHPMVRGKGGWRRIGWPEALDRAAGELARLREDPGPLSVLYYQGSGNMGVLKRLGRRFFNAYGPVTRAAGSLCDSAGSVGLERSFGASIPHPPADVVNADCILLWGRNPAVTNVHLVPFIKEAKRRGATVILVDPVRTPTAALADLHLQLRPGTDGLLALGLARGLVDTGLIDEAFILKHTKGFDDFRSIVDAVTVEEAANRCSLPVGLVREAAVRYGEARPGAILLGMGGQHYADGAEAYRMVGALPVLAGYVGVSGGGVSFSGSANGGFDRRWTEPEGGGAGEASRPARTLPKPVIGRAILSAEDPPVRAAWIAGSNPVAQSPNSARVAEALGRLDFVVVADAFLTDTADWAHLFLPVSTFLEREDLVGSYGHPYVGPVNPALSPLGESRSDLEIFQALAERLGFGDVMAGSPRTWLERLSAPLREAAGISMETLMAGPVRNPGLPEVPFADRVFPTPSGKYEFMEILFQPVRMSRSFPLRLLTPKPGGQILSESIHKGRLATAVARCHPKTAGRRGLVETDRVELRSPTGALQTRLHLDPTQRRDVVIVECGGWVKAGKGVNRLTDDRLSFQGDGACYFETGVSLEGVDESKRGKVETSKRPTEDSELTR